MIKKLLVTLLIFIIMATIIEAATTISLYTTRTINQTIKTTTITKERTLTTFNERNLTKQIQPRNITKTTPTFTIKQ